VKLNLNKGATIAGGAAGLAILTQVEFDKLPAPPQIGLIVVGLALVALGWLTNKKETRKYAKRTKKAKNTSEA
jgi:hypothetical protein